MDERIGQLLVQAHKARDYHVEEALRRQKQRGGRLGTNLVEMGTLSLDALAEALAGQRKVPAASADEFDQASKEALALLTPSQASQLLAVPLAAGIAVEVAVASPWDPAVEQALAALIKRPLVLKLAPELRILDALERFYRLPHARQPAKPRVAPAATGPIPGLEPVVAPPAPLAGPFASAVAPTLEMGLPQEEELPGDLFLDDPPPAPSCASVPSPAQGASPRPLALAGGGDLLASEPWDLTPGAPSALAQPLAAAPPPAAPAPAPVEAPQASPAAPPPQPSPQVPLRPSARPAASPAPGDGPPAPTPAPSGLELAAPEGASRIEPADVPPPQSPIQESWTPLPQLRPVTSLRMVEEALARASRPEKIVEDLLWGCEGRFEAAVFFDLDGPRARARGGFGPGGPVGPADGLAVDLSAPSLLRAALERRGFVVEVPASSAEAVLCARLGVSPEGRAAVVPFFARGSAFGALWASEGLLGARASIEADVERLSELGASAFARSG